MSRTKYPPVHPGEILKEEFLEPMGITGYRLAKDLGVNAPKVNDILLGKRGISAEMALRLGKYFDMSPNFWMNLQSRYELEVARDASEEQIEREVSRTARSA